MGAGRSGDHDCELCIEPWLNDLRLVGVGLLAFLYVLFMVCIFSSRIFLESADFDVFFCGRNSTRRTQAFTTIKDANVDAQASSIVMKIITSNYQLTSLALKFDFKWPSIVYSYFEWQQTVTQISESMFNVDCLLGYGLLCFLIASLFLSRLIFLITLLSFRAVRTRPFGRSTSSQ